MGDPILHLGASVNCSHQGPATPSEPFARVTVSGKPIVTVASPYAITNCALTGSSSPPCVSGAFVGGALRVFAGGLPVATFKGTSVCLPTGTPLKPESSQDRVVAS